MSIFLLIGRLSRLLLSYFIVNLGINALEKEGGKIDKK
jgi:hypothetical protein